MKSRYLVITALLLTLLLATTGCEAVKGAVGGRQAQQAGGPSAQEVEKAKKDLAAAEAKVKTAEGEKKTAEQERDAKKAEADEANTKLAEAQATVQTLQGEIASGKVTEGDLRTKLATANEGKTTAEGNLITKQIELDEANTKLTAANQAKTTAETERDTAKTNLATAQETVKTLQQQIKTAQPGTPSAEMTKLQTALDKAIAFQKTAEGERDAKQTLLDEANTKLTAALEGKTTAEGERNEAKTELAKEKAKVTILEGQINDLQKGIPIDTVKLQKDLAEALATQKTAEANLAEKQKELDQTNAKLTKAEETIGELRKEITTLKQQLAVAPKAGGTGNTGATVTPGSGQGTAATGSGSVVTDKCAWLKANFPQTTEGVQDLGAKLASVSRQRVRTHLFPCSPTETVFDGFVVLGPNEGYGGTFTLTVPSGGAVDSYPGATFDGRTQQIGKETIRGLNGKVTAVTATYWPWYDENPPVVRQQSASAPSQPQSGCKLGKTLALEKGWKIAAEPDDVTKYGGVIVELPAGTQLPPDWESAGEPGKKPSDGGTFSIYPPNACRDELKVSK